LYWINLFTIKLYRYLTNIRRVKLLDFLTAFISLNQLNLWFKLVVYFFNWKIFLVWLCCCPKIHVWLQGPFWDNNIHQRVSYPQMIKRDRSSVITNLIFALFWIDDCLWIINFKFNIILPELFKIFFWSTFATLALSNIDLNGLIEWFKQLLRFSTLCSQTVYRFVNLITQSNTQRCARNELRSKVSRSLMVLDCHINILLSLSTLKIVSAMIKFNRKAKQHLIIFQDVVLLTLCDIDKDLFVLFLFRLNECIMTPRIVCFLQKDLFSCL